jgi:hypothetical protein
MSEYDDYYLFKRWLEAYEDNPNYKEYYLHAQAAVKSDLELGHIKKNSKLHKALRELFVEKKPILR